MAIKNYLDSYMEFTKDSTAPDIFNRWAGIASLGSYIGRRNWITRGHYQVFPNLYVMLIGEPGSGKGIACSLLESVLAEANYEYFAADRSSKEKFLEDLADGLAFNKKSVDKKDIWAGTAFSDDGDSGAVSSKEAFILAEEFQDFIGQNNTDFIVFLTAVWSRSGRPYRYRIKTGKSVSITDPCINLFGGCTSSNFALTFPPEIMGQGLLARLIIVGGDFLNSRTSWPPPPNYSLRSELSSFLISTRHEIRDELVKSADVEKYLDHINQTYVGSSDPRFKDYNNRRFTQLLKLTTINCIARMSVQINMEDVDRSNELLLDTEQEMSKAIGAFGKSRHSDVTNKVIQALHQATGPLTLKQLWRIVCDDLEKYEDLGDILNKLQLSERIQNAPGGGYLPLIHVKPKIRLVKEEKSGD